MGFFRFRKSIKLAPGIKINLNKKSVSLTTGVKGFHHTVGTRGSQTTIGLPGTGLSYTHVSPRKSSSASASAGNTTRRSSGSKMTVCPNCGHRMRKQWDNCPKCHYPLTVPTTATAEADDFTAISENQYLTDASSTSEQTYIQQPATEIIPPDANNNEPPIDPPEEKKNNKTGCGCLIFLILFIIGLFSSCFGDTEENKQPASQPVPAQTQQVEKQTESKTSETKSAAPATAPVVAPVTSAPATPAPAPKQNITYIANGNTGKIHRESCRYVRRMKEGNKIYIEGIDAAKASGYVPCKSCRPF